LNVGFTVVNAAAVWRQLGERLTAAGVKRVGIEASGGYERGAVDHLRVAGFTVLVLQPLQGLPRRKPGSKPWPKCTCAVPRTTASMPR
jgi:transposase